ncbi:MAG: putative porin [Acidobacteriales bacterium]|nr:putative porin [Terriglobales bacterium]
MNPLMKKFVAVALTCVMVAPVAGAQTAAKKRSAKAAAPAGAAMTSEDLRALRDAIAAQQQQINDLKQELLRRDEAARAAMQQLRDTQSAAAEASNKASAASETAAGQATTVESLKADLENVKLNQQNAAISTQEDQKRVGALESLAGRFRFSGDIRVRSESFLQSYNGCDGNCPDRHRARFRARFGIDGKLGEDFIGGLYFASGAVVNGAPDFKDPVSTNETLTSFFERKTFGIDRAFITYAPAKYKWLQLTGGKFAANWAKTVLTFDNDLNPEGFTQKLSFDMKNKIFRNVTLQGMQLLFNEVSGGTDSNAVGGSFSARMQLGSRITFTPSYTILNWNGVDAIAQAANPVTLPQPNTPAVGTPLPQPTTQPVRIINANSLTNATAIVGVGASQRRVFVSRFMYSDFIGNLTVKTWSAKYPLNFIGEYEKNLRSKVADQNTMYYIETSVGQQRNKYDLQLGYSYANIDQDAVISQFNESDMRAPTNLVQNRFFVNWLLRNNITISGTWWIGKTKDPTLQNAALASQRPAGQPAATVFERNPYLNRLQFDIIYKF